MGPDLRRPRDGRLGRGDLHLDLRADRAEPDAQAKKRAELDLQISLFAEHEITKVVTMVDAIADHLGVPHPAQDEVDELKNDVAPEAVLDAIDSSEESRSPSSRVAPEGCARGRSDRAH